jgi:hypothetical protein
MPPQAAGMSCYSMAEEIIPGRADYLVELRGFEAVNSAARAPALGRRLLERDDFGLNRLGFPNRAYSDSPC